MNPRMDDDEFRAAVLRTLQEIVDTVAVSTSGVESTLNTIEADVRELNDRVGYLCDVLGPDEDD